MARPVFEYANGYLNGNNHGIANKRASCFVSSNKDDTKSDFVSGGGRSNSRDRERHKANRRSCDLSSAVEQGCLDGFGCLNLHLITRGQ